MILNILAFAALICVALNIRAEIKLLRSNRLRKH